MRNRIVISFICGIVFLLPEVVLGNLGSKKNLSVTPWRFHKIIPLSNKLLSTKIFVDNNHTPQLNDGNINSSWTQKTTDQIVLTIALEELSELGLFRMKFKENSVKRVCYKIEGSNDLKNWTLLSDNWEGQKSSHYIVGSVTDINNTVGFTESVAYSYIESPLSGKFEQLRITLQPYILEKDKRLPISVNEIEIYPKNKVLSNQELCSLSFNDENWEKVGIPHCYNDLDSYLNENSGEAWKGVAWYRKQLLVEKEHKGKRIYLEFKGVSIGCTIFVNGYAMPGKTDVKQPETVTHVGSFIPFVLDITDHIKWGEKNILAVKVSNARNTFFTWPEFGTSEPFGQAYGGITCPVYLHIKNDIHIPENHYSPMQKWGTYSGTISANREKARLRFQTNIENNSPQIQMVTLKTEVKDANKRIVLSFSDTQQIPSGNTILFDRQEELHHPNLWYPASSLLGTPYLYTITRQVYVDKKIVDVKEEKLGIRTITWDKDYCYVNGEKCILKGFGHRNTYPALGAAVPSDLQWKDVKSIADCGANTLRIGHQPPFSETIEACDKYGILLMLNSGDNEWSLKNEPANTYKREYDRDAIIAFRNHPSVAVWESNNGLAYDGVKYMPSSTLKEVNQWDYIQPRIVMNRDGFPDGWDKKYNLMVGYSNRYTKVEGYPSINTEVYGANWEGRPCWNIARFDYENEKKFCDFYIRDYLSNIDNKACGWIDWMLAETQGEGYTIYLNGMSKQKSLGSCAMDGNRLPKLKYHIYKNALWMPFEKRPGVVLQSCWREAKKQDIDVWSNCPKVELFINGKSLGKQYPDQATKQCTWSDIEWEPGTLKAIGLNHKDEKVCENIVKSSGEPFAVVLLADKTTTNAEGKPFQWIANGSDVITFTARIVDKDGNWCPEADNMITFDTTGEGAYKGSYNFYVTPEKPRFYHAPGDKELQAEGGLMRVAVRTTFNSGKIEITASSPGLITGTAKVKTKSIK